MSKDIGEAFNPLNIDEEESLRHEILERDGQEVDWYADILTYEDCSEIEMLYVFQDPQDEILNKISGRESFYEFDYTGRRIYPTIDSRGKETRVKGFIPVSDSLNHEISEFPSQYLEDIRDEFYEQVLSAND